MVRSLLTAVLLIITPACAIAQSAAAADSTSLTRTRLVLFLLPPSVAVAGGFVYANNAPWSGERRPFHLHGGNDFRYALNLDKVGHFYAGATIADITAALLRSAGMSRTGALRWGGFSSALVQLGFEYKDGLAPDWGFSVYDVAAGTLGAFYPCARERYPWLSETRIKLGYALRSNAYWSRKGQDGQLVDDYVNQTYWLSIRLKSVLPAGVGRHLPRFLRVAAGLSIDEEVNGGGGGHREVFVGLDYCLSDLFARPRSGLLAGILDVLEYVKLPAPAVRLSPAGRAFWLYW